MAYMVPPGLEDLAQLDKVLVKQHIEFLEVFLGCEMNNKYSLKNSMDQEFLQAKENTDCCSRNCCGPMRAFEMALINSQEQEIIHLSRPYTCIHCCWPCCLQRLEVSCPPGTPLGSVHQEWGFCTPIAAKFSVRNVSGDTVFIIQGPVCTMSCGSDVVFKILSEDGSDQVGNITKLWRGCCSEVLTDAENFSITFPMELEVRIKALLVGAAFLIDFMYFEKQRD
ncbi:phospholipid scramblase 2 [Procambarus clarkii]|uniref:phospholipid scramblase 2 n=1 Tax=Procambarus clarkii TaxID=6728 RepID=UPI001E67163A|nr:phospholipid scramblase 2-like [Procambarus clarkii]XP_045591235.1 phospholipid scramblase 2-like [Procambarus clarkii]